MDKLDLDSLDDRVYVDTLRAVLTLTECRRSHRGVLLEKELLKGLVNLCNLVTEVQWIGDLKAAFGCELMKANSSIQQQNGIHLQLQQIEIWCKYMDQIIYRGRVASDYAILNYQKMWFSYVGDWHPLDFQYDPHELYNEKDIWMHKNDEMTIGSQAEASAKNEFFFTVMIWEKLEELGKHNQASTFDRYELRAIFRVLRMHESATDSFPKDPTFIKVYMSAVDMQGASFTAQEVAKLCAVGDVLPRPKPIPRPASSKSEQPTPEPTRCTAQKSSAQSPAPRLQGTSKQTFIPDASCSSASVDIDLRAKAYAGKMGASLFDFVSRATKSGSMEISRAKALPLLAVCKSVLENTSACPVDEAKDPAHPQVTAFGKLFAAVDNKHLGSITLDSEEVCCLSKLFKSLEIPLENLPQLKAVLDGWQNHETPSFSTFPGKPSKSTKKKPQSQSTEVKSVAKDSLARTTDLDVSIEGVKEIVDRMSSICEIHFPEVFLKNLDKLDRKGGSALKAYADIIYDGLISMQNERDKSLEQLTLLRKKVQETEAKIHNNESKAAEDLRSERGAYATLKKNLNKKIECLEKDLDNTQKSIQKAETKIAKRAQQHSTYVQKLQGQLKSSGERYQQEAEAHSIIKLDYESTLEELNSLKAITKKTSDEHDAKMLAQEQELAKLRSTRTNPKIEKDNVERAVRDAVRVKQTELDAVKAESRQKQAEIERLQIELCDMQDALQQKEFELDEKQLELNDMLTQLADDKPAIDDKDEIIKALTGSLSSAQEALEEQIRLARTLPSIQMVPKQKDTLEVELQAERAKTTFLEGEVRRMSSALSYISTASAKAKEIQWYTGERR